MKRYLIYMAILYGLLFMPYRVQALSCDNRTIAEYREFTNNIKITTDYVMQDGQPVFTIIFNNIHSGIYVRDETTHSMNIYREFDEGGQLTLEGYRADQKRTFAFYLDGCYGSPLATRYVTLPAYNAYADDQACSGIEEFNLCQRWAKVSVSRETFLEKTSEYRENKFKQPEPEPEVKEDTWQEKVLKFIGKYYVYLISGVIIFILLLSAIKILSVKKHQFNFKV